jgi:hypothetical protein
MPDHRGGSIKANAAGSNVAAVGFQNNASTQIRWGLRYIRARYGSPRRAWNHSQATGWY